MFPDSSQTQVRPPKRDHDGNPPTSEPLLYVGRLCLQTGDLINLPNPPAGWRR